MVLLETIWSGLMKRLHSSAACPRLRPYAGAGSLSSARQCSLALASTFRPLQLVSIRHTISRTVEHSPSERSYCVRDESAAARRVLERNPACLDTYLCLRSDRPMDQVGEFANGFPYVPKSHPHGMLDLVVRSPRPDLPQGWPAVYWDCADRGRLRGSHVVDTALFHSNQYCAASACEHCAGVIHDEPWCLTRNSLVLYAYEVALQAESCHCRIG